LFAIDSNFKVLVSTLLWSYSLFTSSDVTCLHRACGVCYGIQSNIKHYRNDNNAV